MNDEVIFLILGVYLPYIVALGLARYARSQVARILSGVVPTAMLTAFSVHLLLISGCEFDDFRFHTCARGDGEFARRLSVVNIWLLIVHLFLMPVVALVAAGFEWYARRKPRQCG